ncbi:MAG: hypothetical protein QOD06_1669 [Candidatus Binatota bacterium]|nr:hypothetical protein [Candidatus Binatota bacterium]
MEPLLKRWGLLAIFLGAATEGDVTMIVAGVMAHLGLVDFTPAIIVGTLGGFSADLAVYGAGRLRREAVRASRLYRRVGPTIERFADRMGVWQITIARFLYGTNLVAMFFWGVRALSLAVFVPLALAGCAVWASLLGALGFLMSRSATALIVDVKKAEIWILGMSVAAATVTVAARFLLRRHWTPSA